LHDSVAAMLEESGIAARRGAKNPRAVGFQITNVSGTVPDPLRYS